MKSSGRIRGVLPSTLSFIRESRTLSRFSFFDLLHGYSYARWTYFYIAIATGEHPLTRVIERIFTFVHKLFSRRETVFKESAEVGRKAINTVASTPDQLSFANTYHGKVLPLQEAKRLVTLNRDIAYPNLEHVIPYSQARDLILKNPDHIVVIQCPCRASRKHPCQPLDVCLIVGEPFASFMREHHPEKTRWITAAEAVDILQAEDRRGHVHHAFFKDAMLGRFYAICNCCACCCGAMQAQRNGTPMLASSGYLSLVNRSLCTGCGKCLAFCQFKALSVIEKKNTVNSDLCMGCGVCLDKCEHQALSLVANPSKGIPLELEHLIAQAERHKE